MHYFLYKHGSLVIRASRLVHIKKMGSRSRRMVEMALRNETCFTPEVDLAVTNSNNPLYVMEPDKELLDCLNMSEPMFENLDNAVIIGEFNYIVLSTKYKALFVFRYRRQNSLFGCTRTK